MALTKRTYTDGETIITAQNLNDIQDEIISQGNNKANKSATVSNIVYNNNSNHKLQKTINGTTTDVFTVETTPTANSVNPVSSGAAKVINDALANVNFADAINISTTSQDLNNYTDGGIWYFGSTYTPTNKPSDAGNYGFLIVIRGGSNAKLFQIWLYTARSGTNMWIRSSATNTVNFGDWKRLLTSADMTTKDISTSASVANPLPSGVTAAYVTVVQAGNLVTVHASVTRDSTSITSFSNGQIATGLPAPTVVPRGSGNVVIPFGEISAATATDARPLLCTVTSDGYLQVRYGAVASTYNGSFTYLTNDFSKL